MSLWFNPIILPLITDKLALKIINPSLPLFNVKRGLNKLNIPGSFWIVLTTKQPSQVIEAITKGTQKKKGNIPSFSKNPAKIIILEALTTPTRKTLEPMAWTIKYLIRPSVSNSLLKLNKGMKPNKDISNLNHTVNQFELLKTNITETVITLIKRKKDGFSFTTEGVYQKIPWFETKCNMLYYYFSV